ncbi:MAG: DUF4388 domain-containing protein [Candidatus Goldbacteria bacterium]|nr:DUF4388 domain-containing protein [Candidatus Goldiibacteriota bacterium]
MKGTVNSISVAGMLRLLCNYQKTGILNVDHNKAKGLIHIFEGAVTFAREADSAEVKEALYKMLLVIDEGSFYFEETRDVEKQPLNISVENIILESSRKLLDAGMDISDYLLLGREVLKISTFSENKKVSVDFLSREWNLMAAFDGSNNIDFVLEHSGIDEKEAKTALFGLLAAGLLKRSRFKTPEIGRVAAESLGNIGLAIVDSEFKKHGIDRNRMGMKEFILLLNSLENSFSEIVGKTKSAQVIEKIWASTR